MAGARLGCRLHGPASLPSVVPAPTRGAVFGFRRVGGLGLGGEPRSLGRELPRPRPGERLGRPVAAPRMHRPRPGVLRNGSAASGRCPRRRGRRRWVGRANARIQLYPRKLLDEFPAEERGGQRPGPNDPVISSRPTWPAVPQPSPNRRRRRPPRLLCPPPRRPT